MFHVMSFLYVLKLHFCTSFLSLSSNNHVLSFRSTSCRHYSAANYIILTAQLILSHASCYHCQSFSLKLPRGRQQPLQSGSTKQTNCVFSLSTATDSVHERRRLGGFYCCVDKRRWTQPMTQTTPDVTYRT